MKVAIVGEAPSRVMVEGDPPLLLARRELAQMAGVHLSTFLEEFELYNVFQEWPGKGDEFPADAARALAVEMWPALREKHKRVVLLGQRVARAFCLPQVPYFRDVMLPWLTYVVAPHPSHVSHWWNDATNRRCADEFWTRELRMQRPAYVDAGNAPHRQGRTWN